MRIKLNKILLILILISSTALAQDSRTVYITKTGLKYHTSNCSSLRKSKIAVSLSDAKSRGFTACSICKP